MKTKILKLQKSRIIIFRDIYSVYKKLRLTLAFILVLIFNNYTISQVTIFSDCDYNGQSKILDVGNYNFNQMGLDNDNISSLKVNSGYEVTLFEHGDFSGKELKLTSDVKCLTEYRLNEQFDWNDQVSGIKIVKKQNNSIISGKLSDEIGKGGKNDPIVFKFKSIYKIPQKLSNGTIKHYTLSKNENNKDPNGFTEKEVQSTSEQDKETTTGTYRECRSVKKKLSFETMDQNILNNETISNFYPGVVYDLLDVQNIGQYKEIKKDRNPMTLVIKAQTVTNPSVQINEVNKTNILNSIAELKNRKGNKYEPVTEYTSIVRAYNQQDMEFKAKLYFGFPGGSVNNAFKYNSGSKKETYLMLYKQDCYSIEAIPNSDGIFKSSIDNKNDNLVYVDKVTYGVKLLIKFEIDEGYEDIENNFNGDYNSLSYAAKVKLDISNKERYKNVKFEIFGYGLSAFSTSLLSTATGIDDLNNKLNELYKKLDLQRSDYPSTWGKEVSYSLRFLDGSTAIAYASLDDGVVQRECKIFDPNQLYEYKITLNRIIGIGDSEIFGDCSVTFKNNEDIKVDNAYGSPNGLLWKTDRGARWKSKETREIGNSIAMKVREKDIKDYKIILRIFVDEADDGFLEYDDHYFPDGNVTKEDRNNVILTLEQLEQRFVKNGKTLTSINYNNKSCEGNDCAEFYFTIERIPISK
jgi:hypothetical protein